MGNLSCSTFRTLPPQRLSLQSMQKLPQLKPSRLPYCMGGAKKADKLYPATREALNIIKRLRQQAKDAKIIRDILKPYSHELAKGVMLWKSLNQCFLPGVSITHLHGIGSDE